MNDATIIVDEPIIEVLAEMKLNESGVLAMAEWVKRTRPECVRCGRRFGTILCERRGA